MSDEPLKTESIGPSRPETPLLWKDRYLIERELGRGGFGIVYLARDQQLLSKRVVVKVLLAGVNPDPYVQKKFRQEIEALARIDHPGIVGVLDVGETPDSQPFIVMQFVEGVTLRSLIGKGDMPLRQVSRIVQQICQALTAAHEKGVYHRDLKPENVMLQSLADGEVQVKLIDFGIATVKDSQVASQTQASMVVGTLAYMAPEQVLGQSSPASDIYALGVIAFEMVTGQRPENSPQGVLTKPCSLRPDLPVALQDVILKALSYRPEERQSRPRDFGDQFAAAAGEAPAPTAPQLPAVQALAAPDADSAAGLEMAYVLFMDLVGYSALPMDQQSRRIQQLQEVVRSTPEFQQALKNDQLISLPTGDGMALVFFQNPMIPVQCATKISSALRNQGDLKLRMGIHTGPVYRIADINTNRNVAGGGINLAQRVMDCGDSGHILLSRAVADVLGQLSDWSESLHDLGEAEVKHGTKIHVVNLYSGDVGNPNLPQKFAKMSAAKQIPPAAVAVEPTVVHVPAARGGKGLWIGGAAAAALVVVLLVSYSGVGGKGSPPPPGREETPTPPGGVLPPPGPPQVPQDPAPPSNPRGGISPIPGGRGTEPPKGPPEPAPGVIPPVAPPSTPAPSAPPPAPPAAAVDPALQEQRERMIQLAARANAVARSMTTIEQQQNRQGVNMRGDMAAAKDSMQYLMDEAKTALNSGNAATVKRNLDLAERQIEKLEGFLGR